MSYVIDEADLVLGFGYDEDVSALIDRLQSQSKPQGILLSATLGADVRGLKKLALRKRAHAQPSTRPLVRRVRRESGRRGAARPVLCRGPGRGQGFSDVRHVETWAAVGSRRTVA